MSNGSVVNNTVPVVAAVSIRESLLTSIIIDHRPIDGCGAPTENVGQE